MQVGLLPHFLLKEKWCAACAIVFGKMATNYSVITLFCCLLCEGGEKSNCKWGYFKLRTYGKSSTRISFKKMC